MYYSSPLATLTTTYDTMGRPTRWPTSNGTTWVQNVAYDYAGRLNSMQVLSTTETRSYNTSGQLASINWSTPGTPSLTGGLTY